MQPDILITAKGLTSGTIPMGAVFCSEAIYQSVVGDSPVGIEFSHGYTYSAHPTACAAAIACLDIYEEEGLFSRAGGNIGRYFENVLHSMADLPGVIDVRNYGLLGAVEFEPTGENMPIGVKIFAEAWENGLMIRGLGNALVISPPLIVDEPHLDEFAEILRRSVKAVM